VLDSDTRELLVGGRPVPLQPKAFQLLELLLQARPKAVSKGQIHERLWPGTFVSDSTLTSLVTDIRTAIRDEARKGRLVRTVHRFGYAFSGVAQEMRETSPVAERGSIYWLVQGRQRIQLEAGETIIGRDPCAAVFLDDRSVSRQHARIVVSPEGATLEDLGSKNGTYLREEKVESRLPLSDGDEILVGSVPLTLRILPSPESTETMGASKR